jgi:hypothetical protein
VRVDLLFVTAHLRRLAIKFGTAIQVFALGVILPCAAMTATTASAEDGSAARGAAVGAVTGMDAGKAAAAGAVVGRARKNDSE